MKLISITFLLLLNQISMAQVKNRFELGVGGLVVKESIDFLVRIENNLAIGDNENEEDLFIIVKVNGDAALSGKNLSYLDFSFDVAPAVELVDDGQSRVYVGYNLISYKQQRDLSIDKANHLQLSVVGFRVGGHQKIGDGEVRIFGQLSLDLLGVVFDAKRSSDGVALSGEEYGDRISQGLSGFIGLNIKNKYKITFGGEVMSTKALGYIARVDEYCTPYYDEWGNYLGTNCAARTIKAYDETWLSSKLYVEASAQLFKSLSIFGRVSYNVFEMTDKTEYFPSSKNSNMQLMVGLKYKLFSSSK